MAVPDRFRSIFRRLISPEETQILALITKGFHNISAVVKKLENPNAEKIISLLETLYQKGIVNRKLIDGEAASGAEVFMESLVSIFKNIAMRSWASRTSISSGSFTELKESKRPKMSSKQVG